MNINSLSANKWNKLPSQYKMKWNDIKELEETLVIVEIIIWNIIFIVDGYVKYILHKTIFLYDQIIYITNIDKYRQWCI